MNNVGEQRKIQILTELYVIVLIHIDFTNCSTFLGICLPAKAYILTCPRPQFMMRTCTLVNQMQFIMQLGLFWCFSLRYDHDY